MNQKHGAPSFPNLLNILHTDPPIILEFSYPHPGKKVWAALTEVAQMRQWFFENILNFQAEEGFETRFPVENEGRTFTHHWSITEVLPESKITYGWTYDEYPGDAFVTFSLAEGDGETRLQLYLKVTEDFPQNIPEFERESCIGGWEYFLGERLTSYLS